MIDARRDRTSPCSRARSCSRRAKCTRSTSRTTRTKKQARGQRRHLREGFGNPAPLCIGVLRQNANPRQRHLPHIRPDRFRAGRKLRQRRDQLRVATVDQGDVPGLIITDPRKRGGNLRVVSQHCVEAARRERLDPAVKDIEPATNLGDGRAAIRLGRRDGPFQREQFDIGLGQCPLRAVGIGGRERVDLLPDLLRHLNQPENDERNAEHGHGGAKGASPATTGEAHTRLAPRFRPSFQR